METAIRCACGAEATSGSSNGECGRCFRERLRSVHNGFAPTRSLGAGNMDTTATKRHEARLEDYRKVRMEGSQPQGTDRKAIEEAKILSDAAGAPFRAGEFSKQEINLT